MAKTLHFGSFDKYKRWLAAGHIHNLFRHHGGKGTPTIKIQGQLYKPSHSNPAELVIFGNPAKKESYPQLLRKALRWSDEKIERELGASFNRDRVKEELRRLRKNPSGRSGNNHAAGCSCPICKNMRAAGVSNPRKKRTRPSKKPATFAGTPGPWYGPPGPDNKYRDASKKKNPKRRRNQASGEDMTQAVELYEAFQGKDADKVIERSVSDEMRHNYVALGKLVAVGTGECNVSANRLVGEYDHQSRIDFEGDGVILACSPDGAQLYFIGGRQTLDTAALKRLADDASKDIFDLGECGWVVYSAAKAPDYQTTSYVHKFGEESASSAVPRLIYDGIRKQFFLAGGEYHVDAPGIIN